MTPELLREIAKGGVAVILSCGLLAILWKFVDSLTDLVSLMERQTEALEMLVRIYSGS